MVQFLQAIADWANVRPREVKNLILCIGGAFCLISFMVLARSLREALYLTSFSVKTLPYVTSAYVFLGVVAVHFFVQWLSQNRPRMVMLVLLFVLLIGTGILWPVVSLSKAFVVVFYFWTALGTLLLTSGFWVVVSEYFDLRGAKRLFGLIAAGGTLGAMVMGTSTPYLTKKLDIHFLIPILVLILGLFLLCLYILPSLPDSPRQEKGNASIKESFFLVLRNSHLCTLALIVMTATCASSLLDYQFKDLTRASLHTKEELTSFFGTFYGWTGAISLVLQLVLTSPLMARAGIASTLSILPFFLALGSFGIFIHPNLMWATLGRGADNSLRKSLHRSALEVLYVPVPSALRRKTKTFIDSVLDALAEGIGSGIIFLWVTWGNQPSRYLSLGTLALSGLFFFLNLKMGKRYFDTLSERLTKDQKDSQKLLAEARSNARDLLSATFTHLELPKLGIPVTWPVTQPVTTVRTKDLFEEGQKTKNPVENLTSLEPEALSRLLNEFTLWTEEHIPHLIRLLARDSLVPKISEILISLGTQACDRLVDCFVDQETDFSLRRRIPSILSQIQQPQAEEVLLSALSDRRFEVRYRAGIALVHRKRENISSQFTTWPPKIWKAIESEVNLDRAVWEARRLLDQVEDHDSLVSERLGVRGEMSLEHTFRLLTLVLEPEPVRSAYLGILSSDLKLKGFSLEYLELTLPSTIRQKLWPFIGDLSKRELKKASRPLGEVISDLLKTGATLFASEKDRKALQGLLDSKN